MGKKNILVCDNKKVFMKMFKRKFSNEFEFTESAVLDHTEDQIINFDRIVLVIYNKFELIEFLKFYKKGTNILVCIFNKKLYTDLIFLEDFNDLLLLDGSKTRNEIMNDLKSSFINALGFKQQISESGFSNFYTQKKQSYSSLKRLILSDV
ncbi:hypothetical protein SD960_21945 [Flavobacterium sp. MMLR14_040]|uniref:hypothetical protein n=1 Tax=Flavobacterium sp. MMLR14_040 TaxID=3093843 RepID=UPI00298FA5A6|nr:hypothetical protein [Flavobacterium sp. MMLR14_040]MDW8852776.1 hypothetical protein [Flavobacterium sp. MMLR14_040]